MFVYGNNFYHLLEDVNGKYLTGKTINGEVHLNIYCIDKWIWNMWINKYIIFILLDKFIYDI